MYFKKTGFFAIILRDCSRASEAGRSEISRVGLRLPKVKGLAQLRDDLTR